MLQLNRQGLLFVKDAAWAQQKAAFESQHYAVFREFMAPSLLDAVVRHLAQRSFIPRDHDRGDGGLIGTELCLKGDALVAPLLGLLVNQEGMLRAAEEFAGSADAFRFFDGRCYQMLPGVHFDNWHSDWDHGRRVGFSVNLQPLRLSGAELQMRNEETGAVATFPAPAFGDACIFRLAPHLSHRTLAVRGAVPKRCYAGWFSTQPPASGLLKIGWRELVEPARPPR